MVQLSSFFVVASLVVAGLSTPTKRTAAQIEADISTISSQVSALNTAITGFPNTGGTLTEALAIHTDATNLVTSLNKGTSDVTANGPVDEADGQTIVAQVSAFVPTVVAALNNIAGKEPAFAALPLGGVPALVKQDLANLDTATTAFENALIAAAPADLVSEAEGLQSQVNAAFATANAAYASA